MHRFITTIIIIAVLCPVLLFAQKNIDLLPKSGACGKLNTEQLYNDESITELDEFPWTGRIGYIEEEKSEFIYKCLAVLISSRYLLTNAHCVEAVPSMNIPLKVLLGDWNVTNEVNQPGCQDNGKCAAVPQQYDIEDIIVHSAYNSRKHINDIALLRLRETVVYSDYISPICLPSADVGSMEYGAQHLKITGWTFAKESLKSKFVVHMMAFKDCVKRYLSHGRDMLNDKQLCGFTCNRNTQSYLSGSALMGVKIEDSQAKYYYLVGIPSFGSRVCTHPDVFVRIDRYMDWIKINLY